MEVYQEKPSIITVQVMHGAETATRYVVGKSFDEVLSMIEPGEPVAAPKAKKARKARRTKKEMAAAAKPEAPVKDKVWGGA